MKVVAVVGASGFAGSTLVERLWKAESIEVRPLIHNSGNAGHLARHGRPMQLVDVLSPQSLERALKGCTHIINCSRGPVHVMLEGIKNLLHAARRLGVQRFVHVSSSAVYGDTFPTLTSVNELTPPHVRRGTYGWNKLQQDHLVMRAVRRGLPCVTVCPPNIGGAQSAYFLEVLAALRQINFVYVEDGRMPCDLVDVVNLAHALQLALDCSECTGQRLLVSNGEPTTWRDLISALLPIVEGAQEMRSMSYAEATAFDARQKPPRVSLSRGLKHLVSSDVRTVLRRDPLLSSLEDVARKTAQCLPRAIQNRLREPETVRITSQRQPAAASARLINQQLRNAYYCCDRARHVLGYEPIVSFQRSAEAFRRWYISQTGWETDSWELVRELS